MVAESVECEKPVGACKNTNRLRRCLLNQKQTRESLYQENQTGDKMVQIWGTLENPPDLDVAKASHAMFGINYDAAISRQNVNA